LHLNIDSNSPVLTRGQSQIGYFWFVTSLFLGGMGWRDILKPPLFFEIACYIYKKKAGNQKIA
jgi:hypothetical protein